MHLTEEKTRDYSLDNIRCFLMFFVVFAHFLEVCAPFTHSQLIYQVIYTFHMPAFIFLFGYNIKYSLRRILCRWCIPYLVFQSIYIVFARTALNAEVAFQYTTPYWLLWYMLACVFYQLTLPLFETTNRRRQIFSLVCVFAISLLVGLIDSVGYPLTMSRFFVFQIWFLLGYYCKKDGVLEAFSQHKKSRSSFVLASVGVLVLSVLFLSEAKLANGVLYGSYSYAATHSTAWIRAVVCVIAFAWIVFLFLGVKTYLNKKLPLMTRIGQNTWPIFILHGVFVKAIPVYCPWLISSFWQVVLLSCALLVLLGNKICHRAIDYIGFSWLEKLFPAAHRRKESCPKEPSYLRKRQ